MGHFSGLTPVFGPFRLVSDHNYKYPYFWTVETSGPWKKWPRMTTDQVRAGITESWPALRSAEKWFFGQKWVLTHKSPKIS